MHKQLNQDKSDRNLYLKNHFFVRQISNANVTEMSFSNLITT